MQVSAGEYHTALLVSDGSAVACGDNEYGQCNLHRLPPLEAGLTYEQVSAGGCHTVSLRSDGMAVNCGGMYDLYGDLRYGQYGEYGVCTDLPALEEGLTYIGSLQVAITPCC